MSKKSGLALVVGTVTGLVGGLLIGKNWGTIKRKITLKLLEATNVAYDPFEDFDDGCGFDDYGNYCDDDYDEDEDYDDGDEDGCSCGCGCCRVAEEEDDEENTGDTFFGFTIDEVVHEELCE